MKRLLILGPLGLVLLARPVGATDATYVNNGLVTFPPQIDATNFVNNGTFDFTLNPTLFPFDTSNTENYTNNGTMLGAVGFQFDNSPSTGVHKMSASFRNRRTGVITALDTPAAPTQLGNGAPVDTL